MPLNQLTLGRIVRALNEILDVDRAVVTDLLCKGIHVPDSSPLAVYLAKRSVKNLNVISFLDLVLGQNFLVETDDKGVFVRFLQRGLYQRHTWTQQEKDALKPGTPLIVFIGEDDPRQFALYTGPVAGVDGEGKAGVVYANGLNAGYPWDDVAPVSILGNVWLQD